MARMPTDYNQIDDLDYFSAEDLVTIELRAKACSIEDCFDYLCVVKEDVPEHELKYANAAWRRGRSNGINTAAEKMFGAMSMRGGGPVAMEYLRQLSGTFTLEATPQPGAQSGFAFNVIMPEDK